MVRAPRGNRRGDEVDQPPLRRFFPLVRFPTAVVPEDQGPRPAGLPGRDTYAERIVHRVAAADFRPEAGMAQLQSVGLEVADVLDLHQPLRRAVEIQRKPGEAHHVDRLFGMVVLDPRGDRHVLAVERVVDRRDDLPAGLRHPGLLRAEHFQGFSPHRSGLYRPAPRVLEPRLGVEHVPAAAGQRPAAEADRREPLGGHLEFDALRRAMGEASLAAGARCRIGSGLGHGITGCQRHDGR